MRVVVSGLAATYPYGGVFWDYIQYLIGFRQLDCDVLYVEDTGQWNYDPEAGTFTESGARNAACLAGELARLDTGLADCFFMRDPTGETFGRPWPEVREFCRSADLFLNVSASCILREEYLAAKRVALIDSDPMYTQSSVPNYLDGSAGEEERARLDAMREHHQLFFTFGENIGAPDCLVPDRLFDWIPTRQPVAVDLLASRSLPVEDRRQVLTTVASWETKEGGPTVDGIPYYGKNHEFRAFIDLPQASSLPLEVALSGNAPRAELARHGWRIVDPLPVSRRPDDYIAYLGNSLGEFSVAKHAYAASNSGWFSCRTACYLALGVPAVVEETGFSRYLPTGEGLFSFTDRDSALAGVDAIRSAPTFHAEAAAELARSHFEAKTVLAKLLDAASDVQRGKERSASC